MTYSYLRYRADEPSTLRVPRVMGPWLKPKLEVTEYVLANFIGLRPPNRPLATLRAHLAITGTSGVEGMGDVVNLRMARKNAKRELAERKASANRLLHGRSKAERELEAKRDAKARRDLERHRIETGDER